MYDYTTARRPRYSISRIIAGLLLVFVPVFILVAVAGSMLDPHPAWQEKLEFTVTDANYIPNGNHAYQNLSVETKALPSATALTIRGWDINIWEDGHNSLIAPKQTVQAWALIGTDADFGTHVVAVSQFPWPHDYHWARWVLFIFLSACALFCALCGCYINRGRAPNYVR